MSKKISELAENTAPADGDLLVLVDVSDTPDTTEKITVANLHAQVRTGAGAVGAPAIGPTGDPNTGLYFTLDDAIRVALGAAQVFAFTASGLFTQLGSIGLAQGVTNAFLSLVGLITTGATEAIRLTNSGSFTGSSGDQKAVAIRNTINQTGTAGFTDLLVDRTQTAAGSGNQRLLDLQVGAVSKFAVDNAGRELIKSHTGYAGSEMVAETAAVRTTDATVTTLFSKTLTDNMLYRFHATVLGRDEAGTHRAYYIRSLRVHRQGAGAVAGTVQAPTTDESSAGWDCTIDVSSNDVRVRVTGAAATNISWVATIEWQAVATNA